MKNQILKLILSFVLTLSIFSCQNDGNDDIITKLPSFNEIINADLANYSVLQKGLAVSNLSNVITNNGSYTVFAPDNAAFLAYRSPNFLTGITETILAGTLTAAQASELKRTLMYHLISGGQLASDLPAKGYTKSIAPFGISTSITLSMFINKTNGVEINGGTTNGGAKVTEGDIKASNGIIHKINSVLLLPTLITQLQANSDLSSFLTTLNGDLPTKAFVTAPANNTQLFVPTIKAFENAAVFLTGKSPAQVASIIAFHITTGSRYDRNAVIGTQLGQFQNDGAATTTSYLPTTAISDAVVSTKALAISPATGVQTFKILKNSLNVFEEPAISGLTASKITVTNIHTFNGIIHIVDRVLQPNL